MGYDFKKKLGLNFGMDVKTQLRPFVPNGKDASNYNSSKRGLGYVSYLTTPGSDSDELLYNNHSSSTSPWSSNASVNDIFSGLSINNQ